MLARGEGRQVPVKLYMRLGWLFVHISGLIDSFGLGPKRGPGRPAARALRVSFTTNEEVILHLG